LDDVVEGAAADEHGDNPATSKILLPPMLRSFIEHGSFLWTRSTAKAEDFDGEGFIVVRLLEVLPSPASPTQAIKADRAGAVLPSVLESGLGEVAPVLVVGELEKVGTGVYGLDSMQASAEGIGAFFGGKCPVKLLDGLGFGGIPFLAKQIPAGGIRLVIVAVPRLQFRDPVEQSRDPVEQGLHGGLEDRVVPLGDTAGDLGG
jgi:hypothetical protein